MHRVPAPVEEVQVVHAAKGLGIRLHDFLELDRLRGFIEHAALGRQREVHELLAEVPHFAEPGFARGGGSIPALPTHSWYRASC